MIKNICSFCGEPESDERPLVPGQDIAICGDCAATAMEIIHGGYKKKKNAKDMLQKPHEIKAELDKYVVGQEDAKQVLSVAIYNHYKRINTEFSVNIQKSNVLLAGPTGSGKTYLMQVIARILNVPIVIADATAFTSAGYVGEDVESVLEKLIKKANGDISLAEKGIVYIDEIDKIAKVSSVSGRKSKDIAGEGVQQALLKILEGSEVSVPVGKNLLDKEKVLMNTQGVLFVCGGAFIGIDEIIMDRVNPKKKPKLGFAMEDTKCEEPKIENDILRELSHDDLVSYGFIPEFTGRISVLAPLDQLSEMDLEKILTMPEDSLVKQYCAVFESDGIELTFDKDAIKYIVEQAAIKNSGARGLKGALDKRMSQLTYNALLTDKKKIKVTKAYLVEGGLDL